MNPTKLSLLVALSLSAAGAMRADAQVSIRGLVRSTDGKPIASAEVSEPTSGLTVVSDSTGAFLLAGVPVGDRTLDVRRIGFVPDKFPIALVSGKNRRVALTLSPLAQALPDVNIADKMAKPSRYADTHRYDEFYSRRAMGFGTFLTREDIDRQFKTNTPELLQGISGIKVRRIGNDWKVQSARCEMAIPGLGDPGSYIRVFIDGHDVGSAGDTINQPLNMINPAEIEAMEIYKSPSELPAEVRGKGCAAIFIWTRRGN